MLILQMRLNNNSRRNSANNQYLGEGCFFGHLKLLAASLHASVEVGIGTSRKNKLLFIE